MARKVFGEIGLLFILLLVQYASAREFIVGGAKGWSVPADSQSYNQWAERNRFQIGDSLLFNYPSNQDSVLQVTSDAYASCNMDAPIAKFTDGHTSFTFHQSGPYYFISGNKDNCNKNEKLVVVVMADRSNHSSATYQSTPPSPPPSSSTSQTPSPAPTGEQAPSPPNAGTVEINPTPAPSQETPPSTASSIIVSSIGFAGAFLASSLLLAF